MKMARRRSTAAAVLTLILGAACMMPNPALAPGRALGDSVECDSGCKIEWERVQAWVGKHSDFKAQTLTDVLLQTFTSTGNDPKPSYSVVKEPMGNGRYRITPTVGCGNFMGCVPDAKEAKASLLLYVKTGQDIAP